MTTGPTGYGHGNITINSDHAINQFKADGDSSKWVSGAPKSPLEQMASKGMSAFTGLFKTDKKTESPTIRAPHPAANGDEKSVNSFFKSALNMLKEAASRKTPSHNAKMPVD